MTTALRRPRRARWALLLRLTLITAVIAGYASLAGPATPAAAAPTPTPSTSTPVRCPPIQSSNPNSAPSGVPRLNWCLPWVVDGGYTWLTRCSKAVTADELDKCDAITLSLDSPPRDRTVSVLANGPGKESAENPTGSPVQCEKFGDKADDQPAQAAQWQAKQQRCEQIRDYLEQRSSNPPGGCGWTEVQCQVTETVKGAVRSGFQGLTDLTVKGFTWALSRLAGVIFAQTSVDPSAAFYGVYNSVAGMLILLVFLYFLFSTMVSALRPGGPGPIAALLGLLRAVLGIAFAGGIAFTLVAAWDQATQALITSNQTRPWDPGTVSRSLDAIAGDDSTTLLAFGVGVLSLVGLTLLFVQLLFRSVLAAAAALFGAVAMTGQALSGGGKGHARTWFWTTNALASMPFWDAALYIYGSRLAAESDDAMNSLRGLLIIWIMVFSPAVLLRLTTMWDGYIADVNASSMLGAGLNAIGMQAIGEKLQGLGQSAGGTSSGGGGGSEAAGLMDADAIPTTPQDGDSDSGDGGPMDDAAQAAQSDEDGEKVGAPPQSAQGEDESGEGDQAGTGSETGEGGETGQGVGKPNAQEAEGMQSASETAEHDVSAATSAPADAVGGAGSPPGGAAQGDPAGQSPVPGDTSSGAGGAGVDESAHPSPSGAGSDGGSGPGGDTGSGGGGGPGGSGAGPGGATTGGAGAAGAAEALPIVPL